MSLHKKFLQALRDYAPYFLWVAGLSLGVLNLYSYSKLAPIEQKFAVMAQEVNDLQKAVETISLQHNNLVQKAEFDQVVTRIDHISNRVDSIYSIISQR